MAKTIRVGINGFGRIGRNAARIIASRNDVVLAAINSGSDASSHAYLLAHDTAQGKFDKDIAVDDGKLRIGEVAIDVYQEKDPATIPWGKSEVDVVLECTGKFRDSETAKAHIRDSVKHVVISAPAKDATPTYVMGVNHESYKGEPIISNSSCTTNCVTTVLKALDDALGVAYGNMTTVHAVTDSQNLLDNSHKKEVRLRRSVLGNLIPATSGSAKDVAKLFPHLTNRLPCRAIRVPTITVSLIDLVVMVKKSTDRDSINNLFREASESSLKGILGVARDELVSCDYIGDSHSSIVDPFLTDVVDGNLVHVTAWYDNEWGYANRLVDLATFVATHSKV